MRGGLQAVEGMDVPVPERLTAGIVGLVVTFRLAVAAPFTVGVNLAEIVQFVLAAKLVPQLFVWEKLAAFAPEIPIELTGMATVPLFANVTGCEADVVPTCCEPKLSDDGVSETIGTIGWPPPGAPMAGNQNIRVKLRVMQRS